MPFFGYQTTHATATTESDRLRWLTVANQPSAFFWGLIIAMTAAASAAGAARIRLARFTTPSTGGVDQSTIVYNKDDTVGAGLGNNKTNMFEAGTITPGTGRVNQLSLGIAQAGGTGWWHPKHQAQAIRLLPNGGADGNLDLFALSTTASLNLNITPEWLEGNPGK